MAEAWQAKLLAAESQLKKMKSEESLSAGRNPSQPQRSPQHILNPGGRPSTPVDQLRGVRGAFNPTLRRKLNHIWSLSEVDRLLRA